MVHTEYLHSMKPNIALKKFCRLKLPQVQHSSLDRSKELKCKAKQLLSHQLALPELLKFEEKLPHGYFFDLENK